MPFEATISGFAAALADPAAPPPATTLGRLGMPDARRFSVYRNNIAVGLIRSLEARYPILRRIVGDDAFRGMARAFVSAHKPRSPVIIAYGRDFPEFLAASTAQGEAAEISRLVDLARLENAWVEAYHSEDAAVLTVEDLARLSPAELPRTQVAFHPATRLLRFSTAAASLWTACQADAASVSCTSAEEALVTRPAAEVMVRVLPPLAYRFAASLKEGATLLEAALAVNESEFDFGTHLVGLVESGAVASIIAGSSL
jgi:hypothetical protein